MQQLLKGNWLGLRFLGAGLNMLQRHDSERLLGNDPDRSVVFSKKHLSVSPTDACIWPNLMIIVL